MMRAQANSVLRGFWGRRFLSVSATIMSGQSDEQHGAASAEPRYKPTNGLRLNAWTRIPPAAARTVADEVVSRSFTVGAGSW